MEASTCDAVAVGPSCKTVSAGDWSRKYESAAAFGCPSGQRTGLASASCVMPPYDSGLSATAGEDGLATASDGDGVVRKGVDAGEPQATQPNATTTIKAAACLSVVLTSKGSLRFPA